jgi:hypothetical protein
MALGTRHIRRSVSGSKNGSRYDHRATVKNAARKARREDSKREVRSNG